MLNDIESRELTIKVTGAVQESNLAEFEVAARAALAKINLDLVTDEDFAQAEKDVKSCQLIETRIANELQNILTQTQEIADIVRLGNEIREEFRSARLTLEKKVKSEKEARKNELILQARKELADTIKGYECAHGFVPNFAAITDATKGKRFLSKMTEAINLVIVDECERLVELEGIYIFNLKEIEAIENEYPGLFPDKKNLSLSGSVLVAATIESRVTNFKYQLELKTKAEREAAEKVTIHEAAEEVTVHSEQTPDFPQEVEFIPPPPPPLPIEEQTVTGLFYYLKVGVQTNNINKAMDDISQLPGILEVQVL